MRLTSLRAAATGAAFSLLAVLPATAGPALDAGIPSAAAYVQPGLAGRLDARPGFAIISWDRDRTTAAAVESRLERAGVSSFTFDALSITVACAATGADALAAARARGVLSVYGDAALTPTLDRSVRTAFRGNPAAVWQKLGFTGKGVGIAVLDTGIAAEHPDLAAGTRTKQNVRVLISHREVLGPGSDPPPCQDVYTSSDLMDTEGTSGHGTHMASVAAGNGSASSGRLTGMAPRADLVGVTVAETVNPTMRVNSGLQPSLLAALGGINFVLTNNLEGPGPRVKAALAGWSGEGLHDPWHPLSLAFRDLFDFGIIAVVPVANRGPAKSTCAPNSDGSTCYFNPFAVGPHTVAVGATPKTSRTSLASFSSRGDPVERTFRDETFRYQPTLVAPGVGVVAARRPGASWAIDPDGPATGTRSNAQENALYVALSGTSVAAAHVAGTVALMQEAALQRPGNCYLLPGQVRSILRSTATSMSGYAGWEVGAGALDATAAVKAAKAATVIRSPDPWMCP